ncbi:MAG: hypothetical protein LLG04_05925 [Parachlamydia sp.]|nr:hypothetical protein [Parachlamydia sp.]
MSSSPATQFIRIENISSLPFFPSQLDMNENEAITCQTFRELFEQAVSKPVPAYVIAIVQLPPLPNENKPHYKIYDSNALWVHLIKSQDDPLTRAVIKKIDYFAIRCFAFQNGKIEVCLLTSELFRPFLPTISREKKRIQEVIRPYFPKKNPCFDIEEEKYHAALQQSLERVATKGLVRGAKIRPVIEQIWKHALNGAKFHFNDRENLAKCQFIVANAWSKLLHSEQEKVWMWCSEKNWPAAERGRP